MDYEKAYKAALEKARKKHNSTYHPSAGPSGVYLNNADLEEIFPELKESEDERMLRVIIRGFENWKSHGNLTFNNTDVDDILAYLERQKEHFRDDTKMVEQKPTVWKPQPEQLEALMYAIEGRWEMIKPTSYLSRRLEELYEGLVNSSADIIEHPSLPSNIDEAADKFALFYDQGTCDGIAQDCFKAGAKWMAGQGETHEHYVVREVAGHDVGPAIVFYPKTFEIGDKVIVQIRKKQ